MSRTHEISAHLTDSVCCLSSALRLSQEEVRSLESKQDATLEKCHAAEERYESLCGSYDSLDDKFKALQDSPEHAEEVQHFQSHISAYKAEVGKKEQRIEVLEGEAKNRDAYVVKQQEIIDCKDQTVLIEDQTQQIEILKQHLARANDIIDAKDQIISDHEETIQKLSDHASTKMTFPERIEAQKLKDIISKHQVDMDPT